MTERAGRMPEETGDDDTAEFVWENVIWFVPLWHEWSVSFRFTLSPHLCDCCQEPRLTSVEDDDDMEGKNSNRKWYATGSMNEWGYIKSATKICNEFVSLLWKFYCILKIYIISLLFVRTQGSKEVAPKLTNCGPLSLTRMCDILCGLETVWRKIRAKSLPLMVLWQGEMKRIDPWSQQYSRYSRNRAWK
jgi:hypothetical protein